MDSAQNNIVLINDCNSIFDADILTNAILRVAEKYSLERNMCKTKHIFMSGYYPAISVFDKKFHIHRLIYQYVHGSLDKSTIVHHIDGNKKNAEIGNLAAMCGCVHAKYHNLGKTLSVVHRKRIAIANMKRKGVSHKLGRSDVTVEKVVAMYKSGLSIHKISELTHLDWSCVKMRLNKYSKHDNPELMKGGEQ